MTRHEEIIRERDKVFEAVFKLKEIFVDRETSILEMQEVVDVVRLLNTLDFEKTILD